MQKLILLSAVCIFNLLHGCSNPKNNVWHTKYKEKPTTQYHLTEYVLSQIEFQNDDIVIDIGCGDGYLTGKIAKKIPLGFAVGIDNNLEMLQDAQKKYNPHTDHISNIDFHLVEASKVTCDTLCNKAIAINALSWMPNQEEVYKRISDILIQNGEFIALVSDSHDPLLRAYENIMKSQKWKSYFKNYTPNFYPCSRQQIESYLIKAQFKLERIETVKLYSETMNKNSFIEKLYANPGLKDIIPPIYYGLFTQEVSKEYIKLAQPIDGNNIKVICQLFFIIARKK